MAVDHLGQRSPLKTKETVAAEKKRGALEASTRKGVWDDRAQVLALEHNIAAAKLRGDEDEAIREELRLFRFHEHLAS